MKLLLDGPLGFNPSGYFSVDLQVVPESSTYAMMFMGLALLGVRELEG